ncbi:MAG: hypothetical protein JWM88_2291 [Verrucomicrobia bacterium]|nr:hypothetical protein [Verrucomicrobiota bacterium]
MTNPQPLVSRLLRVTLVALLSSLVCTPRSLAASASGEATFDIPAETAAKALKQFAAQSGQQLIYANADLAGVTTNEVKGKLPVKEALGRLLAGTPLVVGGDSKNGAVAISRFGPESSDPNAQGAIATNGDRPEKRNADTVVLPTLEVAGRRLLNMDIKRSQDDIQPYIVLDRTRIEESGAVDLEQFLKHQVSSYSQAGSMAYGPNTFGNQSTISLRSLGVKQTLILVNGHRLASVNNNGNFLQADINSVPTSLIEKIDVLAMSNSATYGGWAVGGVVNVITRKLFTGSELQLSYGNTFDKDAANRKVDFLSGFTTEDGKTNIIVAASHVDHNGIRHRDRDFTFQRARGLVRVNNPAQYLPPNAAPLGATPNIRSTNNQPLTLKAAYGGAILPYSYTSVPVGYTGVSFDNGAALVANAGKYNYEIPNTNQLGTRGLYANTFVDAIALTVHTQFNAHMQGYLDLSARNNHAKMPESRFPQSYIISGSSPANPFTQDIQVAAPIDFTDYQMETAVDNRHVDGGVLVSLPGGWGADLGFSWDQSRAYYLHPPTTTPTFSAALNDGTVNLLRDVNLFRPDMTNYIYPRPHLFPAYNILTDLTLRLSGKPFSLPGGPVVVEPFLEHYSESYEDGLSVNAVDQTIWRPGRRLTVSGAHLEVKVPLVSERNSLPGIAAFSLDAAVGVDDYRITGGTPVVVGSNSPVAVSKAHLRATSPMLGLSYSPTRDLMFRADYSEATAPPLPSDIVRSVPAPITQGGTPIVDPQRGREPIFSYLSISGGNPNLKPERAKSKSFGVVLTPRLIPGLRVSVDYVRIDKRDNIVTIPGGAQTILENPTVYASRVVRGPLAAGDPYGVGPVVSIDTTLINIARALVEAYDYNLDYTFKHDAMGSFRFHAGATRQTHYKTQPIPGGPLQENAGFHPESGLNIGLKLRANASIVWNKGAWTVGWQSHYYSEYLVEAAGQGATTIANQFASQGNNGVVPSATYHDIFGRYRFGNTDGPRTLAGLLRNTDLTVGLRNVFNHRPPFDFLNGFNYATPGDPNLATYYFTLKHSF